MGTERDTLIELAKSVNENNHNQSTNDSNGGAESVIVQNNTTYSDSPEIKVSQPQFAEQAPQVINFRVPINNSETNLSTEAENSQNNLPSTKSGHDEATRIKSYRFPSFSNLIPRSNESSQNEDNLVPSTESHLTPNQESTHTKIQNSSFETKDSSQSEQIENQEQPPGNVSNFDETQLTNNFKNSTENLQQENQDPFDQFNQQLKNSVLNQTIRSDSTWPHEDSNHSQEKIRPNPQHSHFVNPDLVPKTPANNQQDYSNLEIKPQQSTPNFDPSSITQSIDQGRLPLSDPLISENVFQPRRGPMYAIIGLIVILLVGGTVFLINFLGYFEIDSSPRIIQADKTPIKVVPESNENNRDQTEGSAIFESITSGNITDPQIKFNFQESTVFPELPNLISPQNHALSNQSFTPGQVRTVIVRSNGEIIEERIEFEINNVQSKIVTTTPTETPTNSEPIQPEITIAIPTPSETNTENPNEIVSPIKNNANIEEIESPEESNNNDTEIEITIPIPKLKPQYVPPLNETTPATNQQVELLELEPSTPINVIPQITEIPTGTPVAQLMAELSLNSAQQGFVKLRDQYPEIFATISPVIQKAVVNNKTWFRVQVPMDSFSIAVNFCKSLKTQNIECFVPRR